MVVASDRYQVLIPPVMLNVDVELDSPVQTRREREKAAWEIGFHEIQWRGGPAGRVSSWLLMSKEKEKRPGKALTNPNFPGVFVWVAENS
jgi:hypothetical protein